MPASWKAMCRVTAVLLCVLLLFSTVLPADLNNIATVLPSKGSPPSTLAHVPESASFSLSCYLYSARPCHDDLPRHIWQLLSVREVQDNASNVASWGVLNPYHTHHVLTDEECHHIVDKEYYGQPAISSFWHATGDPSIRSTLVRYLLLSKYGGTFVESHSVCMTPIEQWIPQDLERARVNAVVGLGLDTAGVHVSPGVIATRPNHAIPQIAAQRIVSNMEYLARKRNVRLQDLRLQPTDQEEASGKGMLTDAVLHAIRQQRVQIEDDDLHSLTRPQLFGDVLVLPVASFSARTSQDDVQQLVQIPPSRPISQSRRQVSFGHPKPNGALKCTR
ncbi:hypothetical protein ANO11243_067250 [Dothideomycetidae sp. 11243]|nr:hypothetical protein ANO11243_067250 [fungal sp. No.11243]